MIKFENLIISSINKIKTYRYDSFIEKHEGPFAWKAEIEEYGLKPDFLEITGKAVLLPIDKKNLKNITILRTILSKDDKAITIFLKDTTYANNKKEEYYFAGFVAICEKIPDENFYITIFYHNWFMQKEHFVEN